MSAYASEIHSINSELKRMNTKSKKLREQKKKASLGLYNYMVKNHLDEYSGIKLSSIEPKQKKQTKSKNRKKEDAIVALCQLGVRNPEEIYQTILEAQKN